MMRTRDTSTHVVCARTGTSVRACQHEHARVLTIWTCACASSQPVEYYGAEHLLRLFVKMPELLARCHMQREHMTVLVAKLAELLKFVTSQKGKYLGAEYATPDEEYLKWWGTGNE